MDALDTTYDFKMVSKAYGFTRPYNSPALAAYSRESKEMAEAGLTFWTIFRESYMGFGFSGFGRSLEQFEKDSEKWEKLAKEITQR